MDAPKFAATRLVRPALLFYILIVVISSMAMVKSAQASGTVASSTNNYAVGWSGGGGYVNAATPAAACGPTSQMWGPVLTQFSWGWICTYTYRSDVGLPQSYWGTTWTEDVRYISPVCPAHSSGTPCTCIDPYVPDSTGTSCVPPPPPNCPAHATGTPPSCVCDAGYKFDAAGTSCVQEQYTISIQPAPTNNGAYTMLPTSELLLEVVVTDQNGVVQAGKQVTLTVDVQGRTGGHVHNENRPKGSFTCSWAGGPGTTLDCTLTTGYNGQASFIFVSTPVSGSHTITASCTGCGNTANATVNVKVGDPAGGDLTTIPGSPYYALEDLAGNVIGAIKNQHSDNHYLTAAAIAKLTKFAKNYQTKVLPYAKLYLNDASLVWGGLFDVGSIPWSSPHEGHDRGVSVDIRAENSGGQYEGAVPFAYFDETVKAAARAGAKAALHCSGGSGLVIGPPCNGIPNNRHFHVDF
jgi:hypothetical protein